MGLYLLISLNVFRRHSNEAFSALRIQDYKNFLRLRLDIDGTLTVFPIKIEKVPRDWVPNENAGPGDPKQVPAGNVKIKAHLIEDPHNKRLGRGRVKGQVPVCYRGGEKDKARGISQGYP